MDIKKITHYMRVTFSLVWMPLCLTACADSVPDSDSNTMSVSVTLQDVHRCSRISPEIVLNGVPSGIEYFDVHLIEYGEEERFLGGGDWKNDNSGIIPEGALTKYYRGPCPPSGTSRDYAFVVSAMSRNNIQPVAVRLYRFTQE